MEDNNTQDEKEKSIHQLKGELAVPKLTALKAVRKLRSGDSIWTIPQEICQEIMATYTVSTPNKMPTAAQLRAELIKEIENRYEEEPNVRDLLIQSLPEVRQFRNWPKKEGWEEAVWEKIKGSGLFSADKRAEVIESLRRRAVDKSDTAAKIWLTMSGDFSEKMEVNDKTIDTFREINSILHRKKTEAE